MNIMSNTSSTHTLYNNDHDNHDHHRHDHSGTTTNNNNNTNTANPIVVVTGEEIRQFKDILKGYGQSNNNNNNNNNNNHETNHRRNVSVQSTTTTTTSGTLLEFLFQLVVQIYDSIIQKNNSTSSSNNNNNMMIPETDSDGPIVLQCLQTMTHLLAWTTMEFLGPLPLWTRIFQSMMYTVQEQFHTTNTASSHDGSIRYDIVKATFTCWNEFVTSCNISSPLSSSSSSAMVTTTAYHNSQIPPTRRRHVELTSSIQSLSDPKLPILCQMVDCIHNTQLLPIYNRIPRYSSSTTASTNHNRNSSTLLVPNLVMTSPDLTDESSVSADQMEVIITMATLINTMALEIMPLYEHEVMMTTNNNHASGVFDQLFQQIFDLSIRTFAYDDIDVSTEILPFIVRLSYYMREENGNNNNDNVSQRLIHHLPLVLDILYQQMKYPTDFSYGHDDDDDDNDDDDEAAEEIMFRTELCHVYKKLVSAAPSVCLHFLKESLLTLTVTGPQSSSNTNTTTTNLNLAAASTSDMEAILRLLYVFCEAIRPAPGLKVVMQNETFCNILQTLHQSNIEQHPHQEVLCLYYENAVRYYPFYLASNHSDLLSKLLNAMTGASGLQHPHPHVRSRCCFLFLKLVQVTISLLTPYVEIAVTGILSLLNNAGLLLRADDTLYLFETIGLLLGKAGLESTIQQQYLRAVITPHVRNIERALGTIDQAAIGIPTIGIQESDDTLAENHLLLSSSIAAITNLSKGFTKPSHEIAMLLTETLHITLKVLQTCPSNDQIRNKSMVLLQRMIVCVGQNVLAVIPFFLQCLVQWSTCDDILFVAQILNQLCIKFKKHAIPAIDAAIVPFLEKCQSLVPTLHDHVHDDANTVSPPHLETEQLAIRKLSYIVLQHIVTHQVTEVLFSSLNVRHLEPMLRLMYDGVVTVSDPTVMKTCLRFFCALIDQIKTMPTATAELNIRYEHGILVFVGETVIPNTFQFLVTSSNRRQYISDANGARVTAELGQLMYTFRKACDIDEEHKKLYQRSIDILKQNLQHQNMNNVPLLHQQVQEAENANDFVVSIQNAIKQLLQSK